MTGRFGCEERKSGDFASRLWRSLFFSQHPEIIE
jgi:hypothetical protein